MDDPTRGTGPAADHIDGRQILWFLLDLGAVYVLVELIVPCLIGWTHNSLLPALQHSSRSGRFEFAYSHILGFSFIPAFLLGLLNARFRRKAAQFVWLVPAAILAYKFVTFPSPSVFQRQFLAAFHQYFGGGFVIPEFRSWQEFALIATSNADMTRGMVQIRFTAPFYAGVGYSLAAWTGCRIQPRQKLAKGSDWNGAS
jgi:hypothetical protein